MMQGGAGSFLRRWTIANTLALLFGYDLYTPIAHGLTGAHAHGVNALQVLAHSLALAVVAVSVAAAQRLELRRYVAVPWTRLPLGVIGFIAAFWTGFYQRWLHGPDYDILFGSFVLGSAVFIGVVPARGHPLAFTIALLAFPVACFLGQLMILAAVAAIGFVPDLQGSDLVVSHYLAEAIASRGWTPH
jgi:hypothetical protein